VNLLTITENSAGKSLMGNPLRGCSWGSFFHHTINLLKRETLGFWDEEVRVDEGACAKTAPNEEDRGLEISVLRSDHVWGDDSNDGIPEPVASSGDTDTTGTDWEREDFTNDNPSSWTPGRGEKEDEDGDECDLSVNSGQVVCSGNISAI